MNLATPDISSMLNTSGFSEPRVATRGSDGSRDPFATLLARNGEAGREQLREMTEEFVSFGLVLPILKMARNDPFKSELFHGGQGEKAFGAQLDQIRAREVSKQIAQPIVETIYQRFKPSVKTTGGEVDRRG